MALTSNRQKRIDTMDAGTGLLNIGYTHHDPGRRSDQAVHVNHSPRKNARITRPP